MRLYDHGCGLVEQDELDVVCSHILLGGCTLKSMSKRVPLRPPPYRLEHAVLQAECTVEYTRSSGPGGQHKNRRETAVRLIHPPSGVVVLASERRERQRNLELAFERLVEALKRLNYVKRARIPTKVPKGQKRRRLKDKRRRSEKRAARAIPKD
jgi:protein subunit release factor B